MRFLATQKGTVLHAFAAQCILLGQKLPKSQKTLNMYVNDATQYDAWYRFDEGKGYHSCAYLARIARTSDQLSDAENEQELERAIDDIIKYDPLGIYKKVKADTKDSPPVSA